MVGYGAVRLRISAVVVRFDYGCGEIRRCICGCSMVAVVVTVALAVAVADEVTVTL